MSEHPTGYDAPLQAEDVVRSCASDSAKPVYEVARRWRDGSLGDGRSLFEPSALVWTPEVTAELKRRVVDGFDPKPGTFTDKLVGQLEGATQEVHLLMAELLYVHLLPLASGSASADRKLAIVNDVGARAPRPFAVPDALVGPLGIGILNGGVGFNTNRYYLVSMLIELADAWVRLPAAERASTLADPYRFKRFIVDLPQQRAVSQRNALLFLLYPTRFEDIASSDHKRRIVAAFPDLVGESADVDQQIEAARTALTAELGADFNWYRADVRVRWDPSASAEPKGPAPASGVEGALRALLPDDDDRRQFATVVATAIAEANAVNPKSWSLSHRHGGIALNVASNRVLGLLAAVPSGFALRGATGEDVAAQLSIHGIRSEVTEYHFPGDAHFADVERSQFMPALRAATGSFLDAVRACAVRNTPYWGSHSDEASSEVERLSGRTLPPRPLRGDEQPPGQRAWLVRMRREAGSAVAEALEHGETRVFWRADVAPGATFDVIKAALRRNDPELSSSSAGAQAGSLHRFVTRMQPGDGIVMPDGASLYFGTVEGEPLYDADAGEWSRAVVWSNAGTPVERSEVSSALASRLRTLLTVIDITEVGDEVRRFVEGSDGGGPDGPAKQLELAAITDEAAEGWMLDRGELQKIVDLLAAKKQIILYGPPGTGKTFLAQRLVDHLTRGGGSDVLVQFHPSYAYEDFVEGFRPVVREDGTMAYELKPGPLKRIAEEARANPGDPYFLIIDEINRGNLAKVFGELYFLLEYRDRSLSLQYSGTDDEFSLPANLFVIGTMNTADRSIAVVDAAIRRRFYFVELTPLKKPIEGLLRTWLQRRHLDDRPARLLDELNRRLADADYAIGPSYLMTERIADRAELERIWEHGIMPLLTEHFYGQPEAVKKLELQAIERALTPPSPPDHGTANGIVAVGQPQPGP